MLATIAHADELRQPVWPSQLACSHSTTVIARGSGGCADALRYFPQCCGGSTDAPLPIYITLFVDMDSKEGGIACVGKSDASRILFSELETTFGNFHIIR
jgi:hypothetical protein